MASDLAASSLAKLHAFIVEQISAVVDVEKVASHGCAPHLGGSTHCLSVTVRRELTVIAAQQFEQEIVPRY